jgi:hypothetical protein
MLLPRGRYLYVVRLHGARIADEEMRVGTAELVARRRVLDSRTEYGVEASLDVDDRVATINLRYTSSMFRRDAAYRADGDVLRGSVSAMAGRNEIVMKLGRFGEIEVAGMSVFRALILAHVRTRGQQRWTGRVAVIDPATLTAISAKQTCRVTNEPLRWIYEARMGDVETIEIDEAGRIVHRRDERGGEVELLEFVAESD